MKYGFIGAGNMGGALANALVKKISPSDVMLYDKDCIKAQNLAESLGCVFKDLKALLKECDVIFLGVKPQNLNDLVQEIKCDVDAREVKPVFVSMLAGVEIKKLTSLLGECPVIRIMPNIPVSVGGGMILLSKNELVCEKVLSAFISDMELSGEIDIIDEKLIDCASAVSGCGPAFVSLFIEALADGGVRAGLSRDKALLYASQTLLGTALLVKDGLHPAVLKDRVCSPGGTTIAGVEALEQGAFRSTVINAVTSAYEKTLKIGK